MNQLKKEPLNLLNINLAERAFGTRIGEYYNVAPVVREERQPIKPINGGTQMKWKTERLGALMTESRVHATDPDPNKRIRVRLNLLGVEKRPLENEIEGATKQYVRSKGQFIYGKQNFHKGAFGVVPDELDGFESSADIPCFDLRNDCLPEWIFYYFKIGKRYLELEKIARGVGSKRIHFEQISDIEIPLPSLEEQRQFLRRFKKLESASLEVNAELIYQQDLITQLRQAFLREAMQGKLVKQDKRDGHAKDLLEKIKTEKAKLNKKEKPLQPIKPEEIPFEIPENWVWCRLGEVCESSFYGPRFSKAEYVERGIPTIRTTDMTDNGEIELKNTPCVFVSDKKKIELYKVKDGDLLLTRSGSIGIMAIFKGSYLAFPSAYLIRFRFIRLICPEFIYYVLKSPIWQTLLGLNSKATAQVNINATNILRLPIPLPPFSGQQRIVKTLEELMKFCDTLSTSIQNSQQQNEMLLKQVLREVLGGGKQKAANGTKLEQPAQSVM